MKSKDMVEPRAVNSRWMPYVEPASDESSSGESSAEIEAKIEVKEDFRKDKQITKLQHQNDKLNKKVKQLLLYIDYLQGLNKPVEKATRATQTMKVKFNDGDDVPVKVVVKDNGADVN